MQLDDGIGDTLVLVVDDPKEIAQRRYCMRGWSAFPRAASKYSVALVAC